MIADENGEVAETTATDTDKGGDAEDGSDDKCDGKGATTPRVSLHATKPYKVFGCSAGGVDLLRRHRPMKAMWWKSPCWPSWPSSSALLFYVQSEWVPFAFLTGGFSPVWPAGSA
jgi:hypothetical protein